MYLRPSLIEYRFAFLSIREMLIYFRISTNPIDWYPPDNKTII